MNSYNGTCSSSTADFNFNSDPANLSTSSPTLYQQNSSQLNPFSDSNLVHSLLNQEIPHSYFSKDTNNLNTNQTKPNPTEMNPFEASFQSVTGANSHSISSNSRTDPSIKNELNNGTGNISNSNLIDSRRRSKSSSKDSVDDDHSDDSDNGEDSEQKRQKFLERNRVAASKCRQKKKRWMQDLASQADEATQRNKQLHMMVSQLKEEVLTLKNQLLSHRNCNCNVIQQYLQSSGQFDHPGAPNAAPSAVTSTAQIPMIPLPNSNLPQQ